VSASLATGCPHHIKRPVMRQEWRDLVFVHGRVDAQVLRSLLPAGIKVDEFDGSGWVSYVPFTMRDIAFGPLPPVPYLGTFPEVNIRTYVRHNGVPYVWFFSLDIPRLLPVAVARSVFALPYMFSSVRHERHDSVVSTTTRRHLADATAHSEVRVGQAIEGDALDVFLTARWGLLAATRRSIVEAKIFHEPWELHEAELVSLDERLSATAGLPTWQPERCTYSPGLPVTIGRPRRVSALR
jgi:uncharacterized protein YqjF (DUF2071 family)